MTYRTILFLFCGVELVTSQADTEQCSTENLPVYPSIEFIGSGYSLVEGNPDSVPRDPGYRKTIFEQNFERGYMTNDLRWMIPDHVSVDQDPSCTFVVANKEIRGEKSYFNSLSVQVSVNAKQAGTGSFKASADYKSTVGTIYTEDKSSLDVRGICIVTRAYIETIPPKLSPSFVSVILDVANSEITSATATPAASKTDSDSATPNNCLPDAIWRLFEEFGTHFVSHAQMGSKYIFRHTFSDTQRQKLESKGITVKAAIEAKYAGFTGKASADVAHQTNSSSSSEDLESEVTTIALGAPPPRITDSNIDLAQWIKATELSPFLVTGLRLNSLDSLLIPANFEDDDRLLSPETLAKLRTKIQTSIEVYCRNKTNTKCADLEEQLDDRPYLSHASIVQTVSGAESVLLQCDDGRQALSVGMTQRTNMDGKTPSDEPRNVKAHSVQYFASGTTGYCQSLHHFVTCKAVCVRAGVLGTSYHTEDNVNKPGVVECGAGEVVASCEFHSEGKNAKYTEAYPNVQGSQCTCHGGACRATCVNSTDISNYQIMSVPIPPKSLKGVDVSCGTTKSLLGCGYKAAPRPSNARHWEEAWAVGPTDENSCHCMNRFGGVCYAICAKF
eukprot:c11342_g1_i2.p1 GENE.c11342_g1_i2~~c11342_g1_i2.p1  ORF type:complete len:622 (+),score=85.27 c11342_g1_i2:24-1868(+)